MDQALKDLIKISNVTGSDVNLVTGGGGNTSVKTADGKYMYIKASGTPLKDMDETRGWRRQRLGAVLAVIADDSLLHKDENARENEVVQRLLLSCDDTVTNGSRPSVESHLHAMLDTCVIHLHPMVVCAYVNARDGKKQLDRIFKNEKYPPLWVPYADPGFLLARKIAKLIGAYEAQHGRKPAIMLLEKHGLFVTGATADATLRLVKKVIKLCTDGLRTIKAPRFKLAQREQVAAAKLAIRKAMFEVTGQYLPVSCHINDTIAAFWQRPDAARLLATPALTPDELVYANGTALWLERADAGLIARKLRALKEKGQKIAAAFLVKGLGLFIAAQEKTGPIVADITNVSFQIRTHAAGFGGVMALSAREQNFINNWEAESFRKGLASNGKIGELMERIAVVTGAGSGLGRSIAMGLSRAGAMVGLADMDSSAAEETRQMILRENKGAVVMVLACDVTREESVAAAFGDLLDRWGGLDILVNAAGVAPAHSLLELPVAKWRLALEVNLTGYFLMARAAARIMIQQGIGGNIVNLSSKSGLEASKNNTPYNATKAGEIHMARGWAMELGEHGIRVNSVCPGNVFEGSRIWNPDYIKVCAKKYGIRPEEVIPYYVNKTILKREIKGQDIADSIVFLCSERARTITGQTLVADSGQVMVR